jgi:GT2 family glycosyltransferase
VTDPRVSVIVPHFRDFARLDLCLAALERQTFPREQFEIIVADNASPEGEAELVRVIAGRARLTVVAERGAAPTRNGGAAVARAPLLAFTDSDCVPQAEWLTAGVSALDRFDFVGGRMLVSVVDEADKTAVEAFERVFAFNNEDYVRRKGFTVTANLFCSRAVFAGVGGFRGGVSEDLDWCLRATAAGYRIGYAPCAAVEHPARRNWDELLAKWRRISREGFGLVADNRMGRIRWLIRSLALPLSAMAHAPKIMFSRRLNSSRDRIGALAILFRLRIWRFVDALSLFATSGKP